MIGSLSNTHKFGVGRIGNYLSPPEQGSMAQRIEGGWYDAGDTDALRSDDLSGNGNYALKSTNLSLVAAGISDRGISWSSGADAVNLGRPEWLSKMRPSVDEFTVCFGFYATTGTVNYALALTEVAATTQHQISIYFTSGSLRVVVGGVSKFILFDDGAHMLYISVGLVTTRIKLDTEDKGSFAHGSILSAADLYLSSRTDSQSINYSNGGTYDVGFFSGVNAEGTCEGLDLLDFFALDDPAGTTEITGTNGTIGYVTDGSPTGFFGTYGVANKIILNNDTGIDYTDYTTYPAPGVELTKTEIAALHDGSLFFTPSANYGRAGAYLYNVGTTLSTDDINKLNKLTGR
jgi:hypothetical protein